MKIRASIAVVLAALALVFTGCGSDGDGGSGGDGGKTDTAENGGVGY